MTIQVRFNDLGKFEVLQKEPILSQSGGACSCSLDENCPARGDYPVILNPIERFSFADTLHSTLWGILNDEGEGESYGNLQPGTVGWSQTNSRSKRLFYSPNQFQLCSHILSPFDVLACGILAIIQFLIVDKELN